jgi:hypothetical protein
MTDCSDLDTLPMRSIHVCIPEPAGYCLAIDTYSLILKEEIMKSRFAELGSVKKVTRDYTGTLAWDAIMYDFRKYWNWG